MCELVISSLYCSHIYRLSIIYLSFCLSIWLLSSVHLAKALLLDKASTTLQ